VGRSSRRTTRAAIGTARSARRCRKLAGWPGRWRASCR
jgi:hypothetical protein